MKNSEDKLNQAYTLIEDDRLDDALGIINGVLAEDQNNVDAWWLYAHATADPDEARKAINNILRLKPDYPGINTLASALDMGDSAPKPSGIKSLSKLAAPPPAQTAPDLPEDDHDVSDLFADDWDDDAEDTLDDFDLDDEIGEDEDIDIDEDLSKQKTSKNKRRGLIIPLAIALVIILLVLAIIIINPFKRSDTVTPTAVLSEPTPTLEVIAPPLTQEPSPESVEIEPTTDFTALSATDFSVISQALSGFSVPENGVQIAATSLGSTLIVTVCDDRALLTQAMDTLSKQSSFVSDDAQAVAIRIGDCSTAGSQRLVGVSLNQAVAYANGDISLQEFQRMWQPLE